MLGYYATLKRILMHCINYPLFLSLNIMNQKQRQSHRGKQVLNRFSDFRSGSLKMNVEILFHSDVIPQTGRTKIITTG